MEIKFSGFGGQGIIRMGMILGRAASIFDDKQATLTQSFGPEARGGACSAQLIVSSDAILYPYLTAPDILVAMSQEAYEKFEPELKEDGVLLVEEDLVTPHPPRGKTRVHSIPATRIAEQLGSRMYANMVMLGFTGAVTGTVSLDALEQALPGTVPERSVPKNIEALRKGWDVGRQQTATP